MFAWIRGPDAPLASIVHSSVYCSHRDHLIASWIKHVITPFVGSLQRVPLLFLIPNATFGCWVRWSWRVLLAGLCRGWPCASFPKQVVCLHIASGQAANLSGCRRHGHSTLSTHLGALHLVISAQQCVLTHVPPNPCGTFRPSQRRHWCVFRSMRGALRLFSRFLPFVLAEVYRGLRCNAGPFAEIPAKLAQLTPDFFTTFRSLVKCA